MISAAAGGDTPQAGPTPAAADTPQSYDDCARRLAAVTDEAAAILAEHLRLVHGLAAPDPADTLAELRALHRLAHDTKDTDHDHRGP